MGKPAARIADPTSHGTPLAPGIGSINVFIGKKPAWRAQVDFHACPIVKGVIPDVGGMVMLGSLGVYTNHMMQARMGDMVVEIPGGPNPIVVGAPNVMVGEIRPGSTVSPPNIVLVPKVSAATAGPTGAGAQQRAAALAHGGAGGTAQGKTMQAAKKAAAPFAKKCPLTK
ncbi:MAG: hypothetical protein K0Q72_2567 [Armatimonadetes bacterium]|jgi:uncharacterized Zn-binding protein involved in type VI secretion|nr:hypothetical protein [Armatimonadota bacterium]